MKIYTNNMRYYFLTCNNPIRKTHLLNEFKFLKLIEVNPITKNITKTRSGATGFSKILDLACQQQPRNKPFQPFVIFEDDVKKYREFPADIEIPDNTDILYIGLSNQGITKEGQWDGCEVIMNNINENIIRVYNMLQTHGMIICSIRGLLILQKCLLEDIYKNRGYDISLAQIQPYINAYALKIPLVYQYGKIGGAESTTKINYKNIKDRMLPKNKFNTTNISIHTNY